MSICYNGTVAFLVAGIYLIEYDRGFVVNQERYDQFGNQYHNRELLMMGIVMPETC